MEGTKTKTNKTPKIKHKLTKLMKKLKESKHAPDTLGTLPDIAANARPLRAWIKMSHNNNSRTRKCGGFVA